MSCPETIPCPLQVMAERHPEGIFISQTDREISFAEAHRQVSNWQENFFRSQPLHCASFEDPGWGVVLQFLGGLREGVPVLFPHQRLPPDVLEEQIQWVHRVTDPFSASSVGGPPEWRWHAPASIIFTSGSSGSPKGIVHSVGNHWSSALAAIQQAPLLPGDRWLCLLPLYHVGGLSILFRCLASGATMCFPPSEISVADAVREFRPTHLSLVPTQLYRWMKEPGFSPVGIKRVLIGGAALSKDLRVQAKQLGLPVAASYGMTETASQVAATPPGESAVGSGKPLPHAEIRISDQNEILIKAPSVALGKLTEQGIESLIDEQGWFHTRDVGHWEEGILHLSGRLDHQFISGGENIQPEIIEQALMKLPEISEAVVVPKQDPEFGHRPLAWVDAEMDPQHMEDWNRELRKALPGFMIPVEYRSLPEAHGLKRNRKELQG